MAMPSIAPQIVVTIGDVSRSYRAFVTDAPQRGDAPATMTLYGAALVDVGFFAASQIVFDVSRSRSSARLVLVDEAGRTNKLPPLFVFDALTNRAPDLKFAFPRGDQRVSALFFGPLPCPQGSPALACGFFPASAEPFSIVPQRCQREVKRRTGAGR